MVNPIAMYKLNAGQDYSALRGINFYLLWEATDESSGDFVFRLWFKSVSGYGEAEPTTVTYDNGTGPTTPTVDTNKVEEKKDEGTARPNTNDVDPDKGPTECIGACPGGDS